jgi:hypothetical protein
MEPFGTLDIPGRGDGLAQIARISPPEILVYAVQGAIVTGAYGLAQNPLPRHLMDRIRLL